MISNLDQAKCTGCGICFKTCPLDVFRLDTGQEDISPCMGACPAGTDIREVHYLLQQTKFRAALDKLRETMPFPAVTGRVCPHSCESDCARAGHDAAVNINALEEFLGTMDLRQDAVPAPRRHIFNVAVVGSGPAGLSAAWFLTCEGYPVTVFEAASRPGGMLRYGIPAYRLPQDIVDRYIDRLEVMGVAFRCGTRVGEDAGISLNDLKKQGFRAVVLAPGAGRSRPLPLRLPDGGSGIYSGLSFLAAARDAEKPPVAGKRVLVIGGGDVAIDAAITARRNNAREVDMVCLENREDMPAFAHNIADAEQHGIVMRNGWGPVDIRRENGVYRIDFTACVGLSDGSGRFAPRFDETRRLELDADMLIGAIGQSVDAASLAAGLELNAQGCIKADPLTLATSLEHVFAAGDAVSGPASVVRAIRAGHEAALSVHQDLMGITVGLNRQRTRNVTERLPKRNIPPAERQERTPACGDCAGLRTGFDLEQALAESRRCLTCGSRAYVTYPDECMTCFGCELRCPAEAIDVHPFKERLPRTLDMMEGEPR